MVNTSTIGSRVQHARELRKMSRRELSLAVGLSQARVGQIEREGDVDPGAKHMAKIAEVLGVDFVWLVTGNGPEPIATQATGTDD